MNTDASTIDSSDTVLDKTRDFCSNHKSLVIIVICLIAAIAALAIFSLATAEPYTDNDTGITYGSVEDYAEATASSGGSQGNTAQNSQNADAENAQQAIDDTETAVANGITGWIAGGFRDLANTLFEMSSGMLKDLSDSGELTKSFSALLSPSGSSSSQYNMTSLLKGIWNGVAVPLGITLVLIFFVVSLYNCLRRIGQTAAGIDLWQIFVSYFMLAVGIIVIRNSWTLAVGAYDLGVQVINMIINTAHVSGDASFAAPKVDDGVTDLGQCIFMFLMAGLTFLASLATYVITFGCILMRSLQLYVYTIAAPVPLACLVSDSSRSVATGFIKRYLAVVLAGVIISLLLIMMIIYINNAGATISGTFKEDTETLKWIMDLIFLAATPCIFAWAMLKAGAWSKELMGIG